MFQLIMKEFILKLAESGCRGTIKDFHSWLDAEGIDVPMDSVQGVLRELVDQGIFLFQDSTTHDYWLSRAVKFGDREKYYVSSDIKHSPIQMVRSRLEGFLSSHRISGEQLLDLIVGVTEALENAVKYSPDHSQISVNYFLENGEFHIRIKNRNRERYVEKDILEGKYDQESFTLMRGMLVMRKLFDDMDLSIEENEQMVVFTAKLKLV